MRHKRDIQAVGNQLHPLIQWIGSLCLVCLGLLVASTTAAAQPPRQTPAAETTVVSLPAPPPASGNGLIPPEQQLSPQPQSLAAPSPAAPFSATAVAMPGSGLALPPLPSLEELPLPNPLQPQSPIAPAPSRAPTPGPAGLISFTSPANAAPESQEPKFVEFQAGELVAVVGTDRILAGDMNVFVQPIIDENRDKIRSDEQETAIRTQLTRQVLTQYVEVKAMYHEFFRDMVGNGSPKEMAETQKQVVTRAGKIFFEKQVPTLLEKYEAKDLAELEAKLREKSMSLMTLRTQFVEQVLSGQLEQKYVPQDFEIDREELLAYYDQHRGDWEIPARARWRQLTVRHDRHESRAVADELIKRMGNEIFLGGKSFEAVARQLSEGFTAEQGGFHDWTHQGSLKSKPLDQALFSLPLGQLSQVIEDDIGFHIIIVLEREAARTEDLAVSQAEIRKTLSEEKRKKAVAELRERVMKRTPIWTRWPADIPGSRPLSQALGEPAQ